MADKFELIQGDNKTEFDNARAAGAAYSEADVSTRPYVVYSSDDGKAARTIASTSQLGDELVKFHSQASGQVDQDFSAGYDLAERSRLVNMVKDQPSYGPEDTRAELLEEVTTEVLRAQTAGQGLGPEATRAELLEERAKQNEKDDRKQAEAEAMAAERIAAAVAMTPEQAKARAARDVRDHGDFEGLGDRGESNAYYLRGDMAERAQHNEHYRAELDRVASPELVAKVNTHGDDDKVVDVAANIRAANAAAAEAEKRKRIEAEQLAAGAPNSAEVNATGRELGRGDFIMPRKITSTYVEQDGKFFDKQSNRVAFEDTGKKLSTASVNKETIADMVALAHAKNWESLKLSGSKDFRREAWLQAESQGIKTVGFTPRSEDLAALETLRQSRATNLITPLQERKTQQQEKAADLDRPKTADLDQQKAPRNDLATNPAALDEAAKKSMATNFEALRSNASFANRSTEDLTKLAYWRGIVAEDNKHQPQAVKDEAVARFDQSAKDPQFLAKLPQETEGRISAQPTQQRTTQEISL